VISEEDLMIEADGIKVYFPVKKALSSRPAGYVKAVDGLSLEIRRGETLGVVGESGSGKSTLGRALLGLEPITGGTIKIHGNDISTISKKEFRMLRRKMQMVFQDPYASLDPRQQIGACIAEPMTAHRLATKDEAEKRAIELLEVVGLSVQHFYRRPHEFSGGQRQRIGIARALALNPEFIVCDEPVSALDVSIQASVLNLLVSLQSQFDLTYVFISHDLRVVRYIANRVVVMYLGAVMEQGDTDSIYSNPMHPYTKALISAIPEAVYGVEKNQVILKGDIPSPINPPPGCRMNTRCEYACDICKQQTPELREIEAGHFTACHMVEIINQ
jgi:oligopeptide/dipeptide ABC transporter ATP-binding protein